MRAFEHRQQKLLPVRAFALRVLRFAGLSSAIICGSLALGMSGYHWIAGLPWVDSLLNAAMILTGMGPVDRMQTTGGKLFAAGYALFSGIAFISTVAVLLAPIAHRFLHALHLEVAEEEEAADTRRRS